MLPVPAPIERAIARPVDRVEILSPRSDDASRASRRRDDWRLAWRDALADERRAAWQSWREHVGSPRFAVQRMAQESFAQGAHVENWRGTTGAYARAQALAAPALAAVTGISILV